MIKVSIVVTAYNIEKYIEECLNSILEQSLSEIEVICVNDASTDKTGDVLNQFAENDCRIKVVHNKENLGQASSRNIGCRMAQGEYLYIVDGDDYLKPKALDIMYKCSKDNNLDLLTFETESFADEPAFEDTAKRNETLYHREYDYNGIWTGAKLLGELAYNGDTLGNLYMVFVRRSLIQDNKIYGVENLRYGEDSPFAMYLYASRAMCIHDILYMRRFRENSVVTGKRKMVYLESQIIQFTHDLILWQKLQSSNPQNEAVNNKIECYFTMRHVAILNMYNGVYDSRQDTTIIKQYPMANYIYKYFIDKNPVECKNLDDDTIKSLEKYKNIIVYGAGVKAGKVTEILENHGISDYKVAVSNKTQGQVFKDKVVFEISELCCEKETSIVIVSTMKRHFKTIKENLSELGFENIILCD
jgi:glycosyltransferase involved in cell wall biosynthesis